MKYLSAIPSTARRGIAIIASVAAAGLIVATVALAASLPGAASGAALASDTTHLSSAPVPACQASQLGVWIALAQSNGAAGTIYYPLNFTNVSGHTCSLHGFPGVSAIARPSRSGTNPGKPNAGSAPTSRASPRPPRSHTAAPHPRSR